MDASTLRFIIKLGAMLGKGPCSPVFWTLACRRPGRGPRCRRHILVFISDPKASFQKTAPSPCKLAPNGHARTLRGTPPHAQIPYGIWNLSLAMGYRRGCALVEDLATFLADGAAPSLPSLPSQPGGSRPPPPWAWSSAALGRRTERSPLPGC